MPGWLSGFTSKITGMLGSKTASAHVGAFGKHPGWDDHLDDLGLDSEPLVAAKQHLYVHGIGGVIDSGKWESLPPDDVLPGFRHIFHWSDGTNLIFGRLWDSSDGKGRKKYPMVVCIHTTGRKEPGLPDMVPLLESLEAECKSAGDAISVRRIIADARLKAAALLESPTPTPPDRNSFAAKLNLAPDSDAACRVAYATATDLAPVGSGGFGEIDLRLAQSKQQPRHIRVPADPKEPHASITFWRDFFSASLRASIPQLYVAALDAPWLDIIVGLPTPKHLTCIRYGGKSMPLASDIPFNLSEADRTLARQRWSAFFASS